MASNTPKRPYYDDGIVTIYHGDCFELLDVYERFPPGAHTETVPFDPFGEVELVLTDPPYGIGLQVQDNNLDSPWRDDEGRPDIRPLLIGDEACIWGGNYFADLLPASEGWLVWIKRPAGYDFDSDPRSYAVMEMAWSNFDIKPRMKHHVWDGGKRAGDSSNREFLHPTQKPLELMRWCLSLSGTTGTVLDPFMGSGTTLRAAKDVGRKAIGIEREERFCEIAAKRMSQESLFSPPVIKAFG